MLHDLLVHRISQGCELRVAPHDYLNPQHGYAATLENGDGRLSKDGDTPPLALQALAAAVEAGEPMRKGPQDRVSATLPVTWKQVEDLLCSAWEGGSNYWAECYDFRPPTDPADRARVQYRFQNPLYAGGVCFMRVDGDPDNDKLELTRDKLIAGLRTFAEKYPRLLADVLNDNSDAGTGDAYLQTCLFGEVVYG